MTSAGPELRDALIGAVVEGTAHVRYHLREVIGEGGQGWVYKANYDQPDGFWVVVKVLRPECVHGEALQRFQREADVLRRLASVPSPNPNIVRFYDYGTVSAAYPAGTAELPFITLEHVNGQTLANVIRTHGGFGLPVGRVRRLMRHVARGLHAVHEQRIIHRDLKPSNILLTQRSGLEIAKVTDFGLVKLPDLAANRTSSLAGASLGYAPPEQYEMGNKRVTVQTDVFAFASVLYEVLSGNEAFLRAGDSPLKVVARMLSGDRPALARVHATVPRELRDQPELTAALDRELARALSADPAVRHGSIRDLWEAVEPLLDQAMDRGAPPLSESATFNAVVPTVQLAVPGPLPDWRIAAQPLTGERLRAGVIADDRGAIVAVGEHGLYQFASGAWSVRQLPEWVDPRAIRGLLRAPEGALILFGDGGLAISLSSGGSVERLPVDDRDLAVLGGFADPSGVLLVGERLSRSVGVLLELPRGGTGRVRSIEGSTRLHGVARLVGGTTILCGAAGVLFEVRGGDVQPVAWGRTGHLYAVAAASDGGAFVVGSGGHALRLSPPPALPGLFGPPAATLEPVQTTRDLTAVSMAEDGTVWAVGGQARLLHRRHAAWSRVPLDPSVEGRLLAVRPGREGVTVLVENGAILVSAGAGEFPTAPVVSSPVR